MVAAIAALLPAFAPSAVLAVVDASVARFANISEAAAPAPATPIFRRTSLKSPPCTAVVAPATVAAAAAV